MSQDVPIGRSQVSLAQLNDRSREIFRQIVESYLTTGEPLGSRNLSRLIQTPLSPASVRNVMADLEQLGLIFAPHTSAGRLPTELGLRFFVDALMQVGDLNESERRQIEAQVAGAGKSVENVLSEASGLLSGLTRAAGVVLTAKANARLKNIEFLRLDPERGLGAGLQHLRGGEGLRRTVTGHDAKPRRVTAPGRLPGLTGVRDGVQGDWLRGQVGGDGPDARDCRGL